MTIDDMRAYIDRLIAELRATRFPEDDELHVHWIDDREQAMAIRASDPVEIYLPHIRSAPANAGPGSTRASMRWSGPRKWKKTLARRWPPAKMA